MPPPYLLAADLAALGSQAGESLAAATSARAALAGGRIALGHLELDLPWRELERSIDPDAATATLAWVADRAGFRVVPASPAIPCSATIMGRLTATVRRAGGGHVAAEYALGFALVVPSGEIPWAVVLERAKIGSKGPLLAHALRAEELDQLAKDGVAAIESTLRAPDVKRVELVPEAGPDALGLATDELGMEAGFVDRVLARLVARGFVVVGRDEGTGEGSVRVATSVQGIHDDPVIDTETYRFALRVTRTGSGQLLGRPWERIVARSGGASSR